MTILVYKSEEELQVLAAEVAKKISICSYDVHGNSRDNWRNTTADEEKIIYNIVYAALLAINRQREHIETFQAIRDTAEFTGHMFLKNFDYEVNCYDTIYAPLLDIINHWQSENYNKV